MTSKTEFTKKKGPKKHPPPPKKKPKQTIKKWSLPSTIRMYPTFAEVDQYYQNQHAKALRF